MAPCNIPCAGDKSEMCGGASHVQVIAFSCLGPPLNQGSSAVIANCTDPPSQRWYVSNFGSICLANTTFGNEQCLNAFARTEHAAIVLSINQSSWKVAPSPPITRALAHVAHAKAQTQAQAAAVQLMLPGPSPAQQLVIAASMRSYANNRSVTFSDQYDGRRRWPLKFYNHTRGKSQSSSC